MANTQMANIRDRIRELRRVPARELRANPRNWRTHPKAQRDALSGLLGEIGYADALLARETPDGLMLIDGHLRAETTPDAMVPVLVLDLDEAESDKLLATLDPLAALAGRDDDALAALLAGVQTDSNGLLAMLNDLRGVQPVVGLTDPDAVPVDVEPLTKPGDLWLLGAHRLVCGDSTDPAATQRLFDGKTAVLMATDPPYLVDYEGGDHRTSNANKGRKTKDKHWDDYHDPAAAVSFFAGFIRAALPHLIPNVPVYQWHAYRRQALVEQAWREAGLLVHQQIIWAKSRAVLTHSHYMWGHERCFYGWPEGKAPKRKPPAGTSTVWQIASESLGVHPTQKPLEVFERPISYHTQPGDVVYEPFAGSGTQFIAAERLSRVCFGMELEPKYVDVAVRRWELYTGKTAVRG